MSGDYSRFTYDPKKRYSGVLMQQGRVQLDSDWNEEIDILRRRIRTLSNDVLGPVGFPLLSLPDSFILELDGNDLLIKPGRLYLNGLVAEAFAEDEATYTSQPFYPTPPQLPNGNFVAYLDVWDREVTYIEDPDLLDPALGGADTTTRCQTVWQLKVEAVEDAECGLPVGEEPSAGRLTTEAVNPPVPNDPCPLPPISGYRGLENRLYRIEVHEGGPLGTAKFKWSRDNASIVSAVTEISAAGGQSTLTVNRIGRDEVLRFRINDWVEVTDDRRELMGEPGEMARIIDIDEANRKIFLGTDVTANGRPFGNDSTQLADRHTRIKRWDQTAATGADPNTGLITVDDSGPIKIEDGIEITFSTADPVGGNFRIGDYWTFWARTATASIDEFTNKPPHGIEHHYVQLAAITNFGDDNANIDNCRPLEEKEGCCTVVVQPGESIQDAIDSLPDEGGCVCIKAGVHEIDSPIQIQRRSITLHGESQGAIIRGSQRQDISLLQIGPARDIRVCSLNFIGSGVALNANSMPVVLIEDSLNVALQDCEIQSRNPTAYWGIQVINSDEVLIERCQINLVTLGIWAQEDCRGLSILNNEINLSSGFISPAPGRLPLGGAGIFAVLIERSGSASLIEGNVIKGTYFGIAINDNAYNGGVPESSAEGSKVAGNFIEGVKSTLSDDGDIRYPLIDVASDSSMVINNRIRYYSTFDTGIRVTGSRCQVLANQVISLLQRANFAGPFGIQIGDVIGDRDIAVLGAAVNDNVAFGLQHGILAYGVDDITIHSNIVSAESMSTHFGIVLHETNNASVKDNHIRFMAGGIISNRGRLNRFSGNTLIDTGAAISFQLEFNPAATENRIDRASLWGALAMMIVGRCDFIANRITSAGYQAPLSIGIGVFIHIGELHIESNEIMNTGADAGEKQVSQAAVGILGLLVLEARVESNLVTYTTLLQGTAREDRALLMQGFADFQVRDNFIFGFPVQIISNKFIGPGHSALVELRQTSLNAAAGNMMIRFERVSFDHNYCNHLTLRQGKESQTVRLVGRRGIVMGNHVKASSPGVLSFNFNGMPGPMIGNVATGNVTGHPEFPVTHNDFNMLG